VLLATDQGAWLHLLLLSLQRVPPDRKIENTDKPGVTLLLRW
jgi:hypothetical protein